MRPGDGARENDTNETMEGSALWSQRITQVYICRFKHRTETSYTRFVCIKVHQISRSTHHKSVTATLGNREPRHGRVFVRQLSRRVNESHSPVSPNCRRVAQQSCRFFNGSGTLNRHGQQWFACHRISRWVGSFVSGRRKTGLPIDARAETRPTRPSKGAEKLASNRYPR